MASWDLSTERLSMIFKEDQGRLTLDRLGADGVPWLDTRSASGLFAVTVDSVRFDAASLSLLDLTIDDTLPGLRRANARFSGPGFEVDYHLVVCAGNALIEVWPVIRTTNSRILRISRIDSYLLNLAADVYNLHSYESDWGCEFDGRRQKLEGKVTLETRYGRSSKGMHPWFALSKGDQGMLSGSIAWSGNWAARFEPGATGGVCISGGLSDWEFFKDLRPGETMGAPHCILAWGRDLDDVSQQYARVGRTHWYPRNSLSGQLPVEWNHWWSYTDQDINEDVFLQNVDAAARMGVELCTLDAGWFGPGEAGQQWYDYRGDWDQVNTARFPHGIRALSDRVHQQGMKFGLWCEVEGLGRRSTLLKDNPAFAAARGEDFLGCVCFGNPDAREWVFQTLSRLIQEYGCDWLKLDFNVDPGAGCSRADHGHGVGDGLFEHVRGYYQVLDRLHEAFPEVVLENCSSGGLRIDLGMVRHTHLTFLSDPDWPEHSLQVFWGASTLLAPEACLHWSFSEWSQPDRPRQQNFDPRDPSLTPAQLDFYTRIAMLGAFGFSQKLPDLPGWVAERLAAHIRTYQEQIRPFVREGTLYRLTSQPRQDGSGEPWCAFQYSLPESGRHLVFAFGLFGKEPDAAVRLRNLEPERMYTVRLLGKSAVESRSGRELMVLGIPFKSLTSNGYIIG